MFPPTVQEVSVFSILSPGFISCRFFDDVHSDQCEMMLLYIFDLHFSNNEQTVADFIFGGSKITADGDCSHEIKRHLLLGRKAMTNLNRTLKSRDITLPTKAHLVKAMVFPVVMYGCEGLTIKKAEH